MPMDQQRLGWPKAGDKMIDQEGAGCQENPVQAEDAGLKAMLKLHIEVFQHADQMCTAASIFIGPKRQPSQDSARSKAIENNPQPETDPFQCWSILARSSMANDATMDTDFPGLDLIDTPQQMDGQDHPLTDQHHLGHISARKLYAYTYTYIYIYMYVYIHT